jgi:26S proteasome regulatory subunit N12
MLVLGLNLLRLLAQSRIAEFHIELESIPIELHSNMYIKHAIDLELYLMEGSYKKLLEARQNVPADEYVVFMDMLSETVREEISDSAKYAYNHLRVEDAQKLLMLKDKNETLEFGKKRNWKLVDNLFVFEKVEEKQEKNSEELIINTLKYAKESERII